MKKDSIIPESPNRGVMASILSDLFGHASIKSHSTLNIDVEFLKYLQKKKKENLEQSRELNKEIKRLKPKLKTLNHGTRL